ncbi:FtsK/SpoIIIE domain-containing protein [Agromyces sp. MMS24-JH15]|uniref:FtsK/SpoIIIE domain-containing protein n=1 Tax=Agromyces sp. MMS24-JH15 TaxID=3243765 RepID=UPI003749B8E3
MDRNDPGSREARGLDGVEGLDALGGLDAIGPLSLPAPVPDPPQAGFPVLATVAPVVGAFVLWTITGSALSLAFAAVGPLVAVASLVDARRQAARSRRRARRQRTEEFARVHEAITTRHALERDALRRRSPSARDVLRERPGADWQADALGTVVVGTAAAASALRLDGRVVDANDRAAVARASVIPDAPLEIDLAGGLGFVGPAPLARAAARAVAVQVAHRVRPGALAIEPAGEAWEWLRGLPHRTGLVGIVIGEGTGPGCPGTADACEGAGPGRAAPDDRAMPERLAPGRPAPEHLVRVAVGASEGALPPGLRTVIELRSTGAAVLVRHRGRPDGRTLVPELVGELEAVVWAAAASEVAANAGLSTGAAVLPRIVDWAELPGGGTATTTTAAVRTAPATAGTATAGTAPALGAPDRASLRVAVGRAADGIVELDLVGDGPHALVAGTTGSGKSEFLLAWLAGMARAHPPEAVAFLLVDFKGGAAFEPLAGLPHVTGLVTDLDEAGARRAVLSLRAELRHREGVLRAACARDLVDLAPEHVLPRLVVVVDEFQAVAERFAELGPVIADIAARGRSLGVHLVLAAQRPNGVVREGVLANCPLRISLRVLQAADSTAVIGSPAAASLPADAPGRAMLVRGDAEPLAFQSALASAGALADLRAARASDAPARRAWLDPLPDRVTAADVAACTATEAGDPGGRGDDRSQHDSGVVFGVLDDPDRQRRLPARWAPSEDGNLLVVGTVRSGRTGALDAVAGAFAEAHGAASVRRLDGSRGAQWDALMAEVAGIRAGAAAGPALLVLDDLDVRFRGWPEAYRMAGLDAVETVLREGGAAGIRVVASASSQQSLGRAAQEGFGAVLRLRHASRADLLHSGGTGELWNPWDPPGSGQWRGLRVQVLACPHPQPAPERVVPALSASDLVDGAHRVVAVVSPSPRVDAELVGAIVGADPVVLGHDPEQARRILAALAGSDAASDAAAENAPDRGIHAVVAADAETWSAQWMLAQAVREGAATVVRGGPGEFRALARDRGLPPLLDLVPTQCWLLVPGAPVERRTWPGRNDGSRHRSAQSVRNPHPETREVNDSDMNP